MASRKLEWILLPGIFFGAKGAWEMARFVFVVGCGGALSHPVAAAHPSIEQARETTRQAIVAQGLERVWGTERLKNDQCPPILAGAFVVLPFGDTVNVTEDGVETVDPLEVRDRETGRVIWSVPSNGTSLICPVVQNNALVFVRDVVEGSTASNHERHELVVTEIESGDERCRAVQTEAFHALSAVDDSIAFVTTEGASESSSHLTVVAADCSVRWTRTIAGPGVYLVNSNLSNGLLIFENDWPNQTSRLAFVDPHTGAAHWTFDTGARGFALDAVQHDSQLVVQTVCDNNTSELCLNVLDATTGVRVHADLLTHMQAQGDGLRRLPNQALYYGNATLFDPIANTAVAIDAGRRNSFYFPPSYIAAFLRVSQSIDAWSSVQGIVLDQQTAFDMDGFFTAAGRFAANHTVAVEPLVEGDAIGAIVRTSRFPLQFGRGAVELLDHNDDVVCIAALEPNTAFRSGHDLRIRFAAAGQATTMEEQARAALQVFGQDLGGGVPQTEEAEVWGMCPNVPTRGQGPFRLVMFSGRSSSPEPSATMWFGTARSQPFTLDVEAAPRDELTRTVAAPAQTATCRRSCTQTNH